jgi:hypothetical protein
VVQILDTFEYLNLKKCHVHVPRDLTHHAQDILNVALQEGARVRLLRVMRMGEWRRAARARGESALKRDRRGVRVIHLRPGSVHDDPVRDLAAGLGAAIPGLREPFAVGRCLLGVRVLVLEVVDHLRRREGCGLDDLG